MKPIKKRLPDRTWAEKVWEILNREIPIPKNEFVVHYAKDPFSILIAIILSQNTADKNSIRAFLNLEKKIGLEPKRIAKTPIKNLEEAIRSAGLYKNKAKAIKNLAKLVADGKLDLKKILSMDPQTARKELLRLPGIGKKTADVFLSIHGKKIMGIDVHAMRIAKRWGLIDKPNYDEAQKAYQIVFSFVENLDTLHKKIISLGRLYCTAKNPKCPDCPLRAICPKKI